MITNSISARNEITKFQEITNTSNAKCAEYAYDAYRCIVNAMKSQENIETIKSILNRLIDGLPLTPINIDDEWITSTDHTDLFSRQILICKRYPSLQIINDIAGHSKIIDIDRVYCTNIRTYETFTCRFVTDMINDMFPIAFPYMPSNYKYRVICNDCLTDIVNNDFDTLGILSVVTPDDEKVDINRYFKCIHDEMIEIDKDEYDFRMKYRVNKHCK